MAISKQFDPARDGWYFENWGESGEFSWDLYRQTYLGINPTHDCVEAPLDCAFYEIFKNCAQKGNCGGMSLLALGIFKHGGYQGFCGPACFYTGTKSPDRADLHQSINIFQARQFSAPGIENFLDVVNAGNLGNAEAAFKKIKAQLGNGDYAILSIASGLLGEEAHTVIPYALDEHPTGFPAGTKVIYVWDPNYPYDQYPNYYTSHNNRLIISGPFDWKYAQGTGTTSPGNNYLCSGAAKGWCFAVPMSVVLHKARQPIAVDMVIEGVTTLFVSGPGCAVAQIEDETGRRFYTAEADGHIVRDEIETQPTRRLLNIGRWPWYASDQNGELPGELYFMRRPAGSPPIQITLYGSDYRLMYAHAGDLIEIQARGRGSERARDVLRLTGVATAQQNLVLETDGQGRSYGIQQLRLFGKSDGWRSVALQDMVMDRNSINIQTYGDLEVLETTSQERVLTFSTEFKQYSGTRLATRSVGHDGVGNDQILRFSPQNWNDLEGAEIRRNVFQRPRR